MSDLLNFDDDADNLFKPTEPRAKPARNLDDIFGTTDGDTPTGNNLDDVLVPSVQDDIFDSKLNTSPKKKPVTRNIDSLFGDVDDEPDFFKTEATPVQGATSVEGVTSVEGDLLGDFLSSSETTKDSSKRKADEMDIFEQFSNEIKVVKHDADDTFEKRQGKVTESASEMSRSETQSIEDSLDFLLDVQPAGTVPAQDDKMLGVDKQAEVTGAVISQTVASEKAHGYESDQSTDSLDMLLEAQPEGTVPASDNLFSIIEPPASKTSSKLEEKKKKDDLKNDKDIKLAKTSREVEELKDDAESFNTLGKVKRSGTLDVLLDAQPAETCVTSHDQLSPENMSVKKPVVKSGPKEVVPADELSDSLDMLLDAQPEGTLPASDNLMSIIEPYVTESDLKQGKDKTPTAKEKDKQDDIVKVGRSDTLDVLLNAQPAETSVTSSDQKSPENTLVKKPVVKSEPKNNMQSDESADSLDILLDAQPEGTLPASDDLHSLVAPLTNSAASSNKHTTSSSVKTQDQEEKDIDLTETGDTGPVPEVTSQAEEQQDHSTEERQEESVKDSSGVKQRTSLKKSMERSFEDLLHGLSDESEPELDDMIDDSADNTNLELQRASHQQSILGSPTKNIPDFKPDVSPSDFPTPDKHLDDAFDMEVVTSTPNEKTAQSSEVKDTTPEVKVHSADDEETENKVYEETTGGDDRAGGDGLMEDLSDVVMRPKPGRVSDEEEDLNLADVGDANYLDVDVTKQKSALGKQGSLAQRRKPSRKSRKSLLSAGEDAIFQDSSDSRPSELTNGDAEVFNGDDEDERLDLSPPAKKPSPATMLPLPGMTGQPPSQRLSSPTPDDADDDSAMDTKEVKRLSKPPPGAFVLPSLGPRPPKPQKTNTNISDKPAVENKPAVFEKPALRAVKPVEKAEQDEDQTVEFSRARLRPTDKQEGGGVENTEERDVTYKRPSLRSTLKSKRDKTPEEMETAGVFEKPVLKQTPKPKIEQKPKLSAESDTDIFESKNLRSAQKPVTDTVESSESRHVFDKPSLRSTGKKFDSESDTVTSSNDGAKMFEKPLLRTTSKEVRSESVSNTAEPSHTFDKPALRSARRTTSESKESDYSAPGMFEKPSLKKTTPSPEKEVKDTHEPRGLFDKPALRKTQRRKDTDETDSEKPEWLQEAARKHHKALDALHAKENQHGHVEKQVPSWLEKTPLRKARAQPLQDHTSNGQATPEEESYKDDSVKVTTPRSRNSSIASEHEHEKQRTTVAVGQANYTPSWMRQQHSVASPTGMTGLAPPRTIPTQNISPEVPQWKLELAQRKVSRKPTTEETSKKEDSVPEWKRGISLRKTSRNVNPPEKEVHSVEPEWKKAAEEKRARLRKASGSGHSDLSGHS